VSDDLPNPSQYHGNSKKEKAQPTPPPETPEEAPKLQPIAKAKKKSVGRRFLEAFTGEDVQSVGQYVLWDVMIPAAKSMILDAITTGIERAMYGENRPRSSGGYRGSGSGYTSYNRFSKPTSTRYETPWKPREISRGARAAHNFDEIILETRAEAEDVLTALTNKIDKYGSATVSDLYSLVDMSGSFTDDKWGWVTAAEFNFRHLPRGGFMLLLPQPEHFDRRT
jgi:hypothetical protein